MKCLLCSHDCQSFRDEPMGIDYFHCCHCSLIFKDPQYHENFITQKTRYDLHENSAESEGYRAYFRRFLDFVLPQVGNVTTALDFGCGESTLLADMLAEEGIACDHYDPIYHPGLEYRTRRYDLITSVEVFEHLHDPKAAFEELLSCLNGGGFLAIRTEFHYNDIERFLSWHYRKDPTHVTFFSPKTFNLLSEMFGCEYVADNGKNIAIIQKVR